MMSNPTRWIMTVLLSLSLVFASASQAANLSVTAASVANSGDAQQETGIAGETITAGQCLYVYSTSNGVNTMRLADSDLSSAAAAAVGIALHGALAGQPVTYAKGTGGAGYINPGAAGTVGVTYYVSNTAGGICLYSDLAQGSYVVRLGYISVASTFRLDIKNYGCQVP